MMPVNEACHSESIAKYRSDAADKGAVRKQVREQKKQLSREEIDLRSRRILDNLYLMDIYKDAQRIYVYVNYNQEVNTSFLIDKALNDGKTVLVPKVLGDEMVFYRITSRQELDSGAYGIPEPKEGCIMDDMYEGLMILPGLAFDKKHHRIGYGGGFYDRYLTEHPDFMKLALCYDFQVFDVIETEEFDVPVDVIITENGTF